MKVNVAHALILTSCLLWCAGGVARADGPYVWSNVRVVGGGFVSGILFHPAAKDVYYARTDIGGAYRWDTAAKQWVSISDWVGADDWNYTGIESFAVDPTDPNRIYLATGTYTNDGSGNGAILRSDDQGKTWKITPLPFKNGGNEDGRNNGERLVVDPNDPRILFFGSRRNGLWKSADSGNTWNQVANPPNPTGQVDGQGIVFITFDKQSGTPGHPTPSMYMGLCTHQPSLYQSFDGGDNWQEVGNQPAGMLPHRCAWDGRVLYVTYGDAPGPGGCNDGAVWKYDANNGSWADVTPVKPDKDDKFAYAGVTIDAQHSGTVMVSTLDRWGHGDELYRSTDGGKAWKPIGPTARRDSSLAPWLNFGKPTAPLGHWIGDIEIDPFDSGHVIYNTGWGMWESRNVDNLDRNSPTQWHVGCLGVEECVVNDVISPPSGMHACMVAWDLDGFRWGDVNEPPLRTFLPAHGRNSAIEFAELNPEVMVRLFAGDPPSTGGAVSTDAGRTWTDFKTHPLSGGDGSIAVSADGETFVWSPGGEEPQAAYSRDHGHTWKPCVGLPINLRVVSDRTDPNYFYAFDPGSASVLVSKDGGVTFAAGGSGMPKGDGYIRAVPGQKGHVWLATPSGIYRSIDFGATFALISVGIQARHFGFGKAAPGQDYPAVYAQGKYKGVYGFFRSDDQGSTWKRINDDQHNFAVIYAITGDPRIYGRVYLASNGRGLVYGDPPDSPDAAQ